MPRYAYFFWKAGKRLVFEDFRNRSAEIGEGVPSESYLSRLDDIKITTLSSYRPFYCVMLKERCFEKDGGYCKLRVVTGLRALPLLVNNTPSSKDSSEGALRVHDASITSLSASMKESASEVSWKSLQRRPRPRIRAPLACCAVPLPRP